MLRARGEGGAMKVTAWFKDGSFIEVEIPETQWSHPTPSQAIEYAKGKLSPSERDSVDRYEAEEDFL